MKRVAPVKIKFVYVDAPDNQKRLEMAYNRIFEIARQNLLKKRQMVIGEGNTDKTVKPTNRDLRLDINRMASYTKIQ